MPTAISLATDYNFFYSDTSLQNTEASFPAAWQLAQNNVTLELEAKQAKADQLIEQGLKYYQAEQKDLALQAWQHALSLFTEVNDPEGIAVSLNNLGVVHVAFGDYPKAIDYYQQSLAIKYNLENSSYSVAQSLDNLGIAYRYMGNYAKAIDQHQRSLAISKEIDNPAGIYNSLLYLGIVYQELAEYDKAINNYERSLAVAKEVGDPESIIYVLKNLISAYEDSGNTIKAKLLTLEYLNYKKIVSDEKSN